MLTGRNSGSVERTNSDFGYALRSCVRPSVTTTFARRTMRPTGSLKKQVADEICRQAIAAVDFGAGGGGEVIQGAVGQPHPPHAALHVGDAARCGPRHLEVGLEVVRHVERAVDDRRLEVDGADLAAAVDEPGLAVVVLGDPTGRRSVRSLRAALAVRRRCGGGTGCRWCRASCRAPRSCPPGCHSMFWTRPTPCRTALSCRRRRRRWCRCICRGRGCRSRGRG